MARPRSTGVKPITKTMADGSTKVYYYDRKTGRSLGTDQAAALARATVAPSGTGLAAGSIASLIRDYRASAAWAKLAPGTKENYGSYLDLIRTEWGDLAVSEFRPRYAEQIKAQYRDHPRKANFILVMLRILFGVAVKQELIPANPLARPGLLPTKPRDQVWHPDYEAEFLAAAPQDRLRLGFMLMLYTLQRLSDVLAMTRGQVEERDGRLFIALRQQKTRDRTNELLLVPVHRNLEPLLRARLADKTGGLLLVPSPTGRPWSRRNFSRKWDATMRRLALRHARRYFRLGWSKDKVRAELATQHRQRRDLRRTGVVRMAEAGVTTPQIAAVAGWSIDYAQKIVDTYLPRRSEVALAGMLAWETGATSARAGSNIVRLSAAAPKPGRAKRPRSGSV